MFITAIFFIFFWLYIFLVPFGCSVVTVDGTVMLLLCVPHTTHLMPWEAACGKTAGRGSTGTAPPDASHTNAHFPSRLLSMSQLHE